MKVAVALACALVMSGCFRAAKPDLAERPRLTLDEATRLVPATVEDREGWALDVLTALNEQKLPADTEAFCEVLAVIEQESNFKANPAVPNLSRLARGRLESYARKLGPLGPTAMHELLAGHAPGTRASFEERLDKLKTERDLDLLFRDLLAFYEHSFPAMYKVVDLASELSGHGGLEDLDPITTAGSMQVSVRFSVEQSKAEKLDEWQVRDRLYTRAGGVHYGAARLLGYDADYALPLHRFADYNAGPYAARNAAFQDQLAALTGTQLAADGDLLAYKKNGDPAGEDSNTLKAMLAFGRTHGLSESRVRSDAQKEKTRAFEDTDTWRAVKSAYAKYAGMTPLYARVPEVAIRSPKMSHERSTAWYAHSVDARYQRCLARAR